MRKGDEVIQTVDCEHNPTYLFNFADYTFEVIGTPWRAEKGGIYYYVNALGSVDSDTDMRYGFDDIRWNIGNYFQTREDANDVLCSVLAVFGDKREEIRKRRDE